MADRSIFKKNLRYHRLVVLAIVLTSIWVTYKYNTEQPQYENGQIRISGQHVNGKDEGQWTWFYENGKKQMQGNFVHGKRDGLWTIWDAKGVKISESTYKDDKLNGKFSRWYSSGVLESEGEYIDDQLVSAQYYLSNGQPKN
jgi:antitoxin component YwqK of YwqJK toxin-antitoxin module